MVLALGHASLKTKGVLKVKNNKDKFLFVGFMAFVASILVSGFCSDSVSAHTATLTTASSISLDALPQHDGISIDEESINVTTTCRSGYNLSVATSTSPDLYLNGDGTSTATFTAVDGTSTLANSTNKWGYSMTANASSYTVFSPLSTTASVLKAPSQTASQTDIDDTFSIYYGTKVADSVTPGSYQMADSGAIVYYLTMDATCTEYIVSFNANGGTGIVANQNIEEGTATKLTSADTLTAPTGASYTNADNNTITGDADKLWTFWGWNTQTDGTGDWYKDKESVEDLTNAGSTIALYAQWKQATLADLTTSTPVGTEKTIDHNEMQDMSPAACYNSPITTAANAPAATLLDYRGKVTTGESPEQPEQYTVSKLADGLCWMTTNLNLGRASGGPNGNGTVTLTSDDTDLAINTTFTLPASTSSFLTSNNATSYTTPLLYIDSTYGIYYTWASALASTTNYSSSGTNVTSSICPKNWDLPTRNQYDNLKTKASLTTSNAYSAPFNFYKAGYKAGTSNPASTTAVYLWTSTSGGTPAYYSSATANATTTNHNKRMGYNIRCVASQGTATINYDGNGTTDYPVTGSVATQTNVEINTTNTQPGTGFTRTGWTFNGWNTEANGTGTSIAASTSISTLNIKPGDTITLYAQWLLQYTITYTNNCLSWASSDTNCTTTTSATTSEQKINLVNNPSTGTETGTLGAYNEFSLTGWRIKEWTTNADGTGTAYPVSSTYTVPSGSSAGDGITLYAHWVPIYTVQYDGNGSDNDSTGMGSTNATTGIKTVAHTNVAEGDTFDLFASNFKKAGYGFVGWSTDQNAWSKLTDSDTTNDAKIWGPNEIITAPAHNGTPITTLYAVWAPAETSGGNPVYLQNWTGCSAMTATTYDSTTGTLTVAKNSITALTDERDGEVYTIAKLADENCWMVENLRLADTHQESGSTVATTLTTTNTNILASNNTLPITNIYNADPALATTSNSLSPTSSSSYNASSAPYGWCINPSAACYDQSRLNTTNTVANITPSQSQNITSANAHTDFSNTIYAYGNYYNWYSATAGYGTYSRSTSTPTDGDLCPAGWHLPYGSTTSTGNTSGGFYYLANRMTATANNAVNSNKFRTFPNNFIYAGSWYGGSVSSRGYHGIYWSASAYGSNYAYNLGLTSTNIYPGNNNFSNKLYGYSVRCVASSTYAVSFDANGGTGTMSNQSVPVGTATNLTANSFTYTGYEFAGWNTAADGSGTSYSNTQSVTDIALPGRIITLYAQWDAVCPADKICYRANGSDVEGTMGQQDVVSTDTSIGLLASNYSRAGYGFAGWNTAADGTGTNYGPQETIEFTAGQYSTTGLKLYAKWVASAGDLQNWSGCLSLASGAVTALTDQRDNETYAVAKLADGNCWMIENMRLENTGTDNTNGSLAQGYNASFAGLADPETPSRFNDVTTANTLYSTDGSTDKTISGAYQSSRFPRYNNINTPTTAADRPTNPTANSDYNSTSFAGMYSYGNYYTWAAAIADTTDYTTDNQSVTSTSICPSGWHLPKGGNNQNTANNEFLAFTEALIGTKPANYDSQTHPSYKTAVGNPEGTDVSNALRAYPNNFVYSGYMHDGSVYYRGSRSYYWSSTAYTGTNVYNLYFSRTTVYPGTYDIYKYRGQTIRCVASGA